MKTFKLVRALAVLAGMLVAGAPAMAATLKIGDPAPPLQTGKWVQGEPVSSFDSNHVYLVEFWSGGSAQSRACIPHLDEIWQKYKDKDLIVIGQDVYEQDENGVGEFVKSMGDKMTYRVALDEAVQLARQFGATDGHKYVNAVLDRAARQLRPEEYGKSSVSAAGQPLG